MEESSYDNFDLDEYTLDVEGFFNDYIIHKKKFKKDYAVFHGVMKDSSQAVKIYKRIFPTDLESKQRFHTLMTAFQQGIVLADNIFLSFENGKYYMYVVEPSFSSYLDKFIPLSHLLKLDLDYFKKHRLFQNLVIMLKSLHALGEPHWEICPKNIWIEDQFLVYLRPFKLKIENQDLFNWRKMEKLRDVNSSLKFNNNSKYWYMSPEQIMSDSTYIPADFQQAAHYKLKANSQAQIDGFASDMWSLGCIFAEMFVSLTPVFQSVDTFDRTIRFFEVLGVPIREDVYYMSKELYKMVVEHLHSRTFNQEEFPLIQELVKNLSKNEEKVLTSLLMFNPNKRPRCNSLIDYPFFKSFTPRKQNQEEENYDSLDEDPNQYIQETDERDTFPNKISKGSVRSKQHRESLDYGKSKQSVNNWWNSDLETLRKNEKEDCTRILRPSNRLDDWNRPPFPTNSQPGSKKQSICINREGVRNSQKANGAYYQNQDRINTAESMINEQQKTRSDSYGKISPGNNYKENIRIATHTSSYQPFDHEISPSHKPNNFKENNSIQANYNNLPPRHNRNPYYRPDEGGRKIPKHYSSAQKQVQRAPSTRLTITIETLKNLSARHPHLSYSCRADFKAKFTDTETVHLFSRFEPVQNRSAKLEFKGEVDIDLDCFVSSFGRDPLKIYTFCKEPSSYGDTRDDSDVFLYGISEIDMTLLLMSGPFETISENERGKTLAGWYHIYDPEDPYRTLGQMKVEIQLLLVTKQSKSFSASKAVSLGSTRETKARNNIAIMIPPHPKTQLNDISSKPSGRSLSTTHAPTQSSYEAKLDFLKSSRSSRKSTQPTQMKSTFSVFDAIQTDLTQINNGLKQKEQDKKTGLPGGNGLGGYGELGVTLQRLRHMLEDNQLL